MSRLEKLRALYALPPVPSPDPVQMRRCSKCAETKPLDEFFRDRQRHLGRDYTCKACAYLARKQSRRARDDKYQRTKVREKARKIRQRTRDPEGFRARKKARDRRWAERHPEKARALNKTLKLRRRARKRAAIARPITARFLASMRAAFGGRCAYCREVGDLSVDHFVPLARGGAHAPWNLVPACMRCNSVKCARDPFEFLAELRELQDLG